MTHYYSKPQDIIFYPQFSDTTNSFCKLIGDTMLLHLSTVFFEGSYVLKVKIVNDSVNSSLMLFDNHSNYVYTPSMGQIILNKKAFQVKDYVIAEIAYNFIGKNKDIRDIKPDTVQIRGKIKLKVREVNFDFKDFSIENSRNAFYAMLKQNPDTIRKLSLYGCAFTELPEELSLFTHLEELDLTGNDLSRSDLNGLTHNKNLRSLNLTECNLSKVPLPIINLKHLETLDIWNNKINIIPDQLYSMISLKTLTIGNNNINYLSPKISQLINLESFESSSTNIFVYPDEMTKLKKLKEIYPNDTMQYIPKKLIQYAWGYDTIFRH